MDQVGILILLKPDPTNHKRRASAFARWASGIGVCDLASKINPRLKQSTVIDLFHTIMQLPIMLQGKCFAPLTRYNSIAWSRGIGTLHISRCLLRWIAMGIQLSVAMGSYFCSIFAFV